MASENGHFEVVRELLKDEKVVVKMTQESWCFVYCLHYAQYVHYICHKLINRRNNHVLVVKELLKYYPQYGNGMKPPKNTPKKKKKAKPSKKLSTVTCELSRSL
jgi:hypothetical protein